jgi:hypothetical protein
VLAVLFHPASRTQFAIQRRESHHLCALGRQCQCQTVVDGTAAFALTFDLGEAMGTRQAVQPMIAGRRECIDIHFR